MTSFCRDHRISHEICGKLVIATDEAEAEQLRHLFDRGSKNGLKGLRMIQGYEIVEMEPHAAGCLALHVPEEGIVDYGAVVKAMVSEVEAKGGKIVLGAKVTGLRYENKRWRAETSQGEFAGNFLLGAAGLHSDRICRMAHEKPRSKIVPFRGEYFKVRQDRQHLVRNLIYPVPDPQFPFLGVHFTRLIQGGLEAGPNAVLATAREGYKKSDFNIRDTFEAITYPGLYRFAKRHFRMCVAETARSYNKKLFCHALQRLVPDITVADLEPGGAGVRAQAMNLDGSLVGDFQLSPGPRSLHVINAPSPAATASLAIGEQVAHVVLKMRGHSPDLATLPDFLSLTT
jgi:L-2-hydroxyglutarate oxidase